MKTAEGNETMKTLLSIAFAVSMCCLPASNGMAADEAKPALFTIINARYGAHQKWSDVSDKVKVAVQNNALTIKADGGSFPGPDPIAGVRKFLKVVVKYNGNEYSVEKVLKGTHASKTIRVAQ